MYSVLSLESYALNMEYIVNHSPYLSLILVCNFAQYLPGVSRPALPEYCSIIFLK